MGENRGQPIDTSGWPQGGAHRAWLSFCEDLHRRNGFPSRRELATAMGLTSATRVNDILRGRRWPADEEQARRLLIALGGVASEIDQGLRRFREARRVRRPAPPQNSQGDGYLQPIPAADTREAAIPRRSVAEAPVVPRQLPPAPRTFVGRADERAELDAVLRSVTEHSAVSATIITVDGTAGVGKTSLVVWWGHQVQDRFPDGTLFADLGGHGPGAPVEPSLALSAFVQALGLPEHREPRGLDALVRAYRSLLAGRRVLVVLDNAADVDQVRPLLPTSTGCLAVVTSRGVLTSLSVVEGAHRIGIGLFTQHEAEELVRVSVGTDRAAAEPSAVAELVRLCARLPLALRVATARIATRRRVPISDHVADLGQAGQLLEMLGCTGDERIAVRTLFDWSYKQLDAAQARLFRRLGLHPALEFSEYAAAALTGVDKTTAYRRLESLVDLHLVETVYRGRYRMHALLHVYAAERAATEDPAYKRHEALVAVLDWYAYTATTADRLVFPAHPAVDVTLKPVPVPSPCTDRASAWAWLTREYSTLLEVLSHTSDHGRHQTTVVLAAAMRFLALKPPALWQARLEADSYGLTAAKAIGDRMSEAIFYRRRADTYQMLGHWEDSKADLERSLALATAEEDSVLRGEALCGLGRNYKLQRRYEEALVCYQQALPLVRGTRTGYVEAVVESNLSQLCIQLGLLKDAVRHAERELRLRRHSGDVVGEAYAMHGLATAWQKLGDHAAAARLGERAVEIFRSAAGVERYLASALETTAEALICLDAPERAAMYLHEAAAILADTDDPRANDLRLRACGLRRSQL
ncbi:tetratricopeptide repeat protein [Micromonospora sp. NPDC005220]|uniref:ATP-binding protein n=1 Tax=Micromonospora sp. NPDC005220 TaxID=3155589 RepID=UPI0033B647F3